MSVPDEKIHPHATGEAANTVAAHQSDSALVFYSGWFCPFVQSSWISLEEKGIPYRYKEVNPYKKEKHFLDINPKGLVPAIEYNGKALYESLIICEFLEDAFPDHKPSLLPGDAFTRATIRLWVDHIKKSVIPAFFQLLQAQDKEKQAEALKRLYLALRTISVKRKEMGGGGPFFLGDEWTLVDTIIAPWAVRDYILIEHRGYKREDVSDEWVQWAEAIEKRDSVKSTSSELKYYEDIYGRYLRDEAQSEVAKATRNQGSSVNV